MPTILHIDDEPTILDAVKRKLEQEGFTVVSVTNGDEGIRMAGEQTIDLVLLDIIMPGKDGQSVLTALKKNPKTKGIPVVMLSNVGNPLEIQKSKDSGAKQFLVKPQVSLSEVSEVVKGILRANPKGG